MTPKEKWEKAEQVVKNAGIYPEDFISSSTYMAVVSLVIALTEIATDGIPNFEPKG